MAGYPAAGYPVKSSNNALKIILIVLAVVVVLGAVGVGGLVLVARRAVHVNADGKGVTILSPGGTISAGDTSGSDADLGVPVYPGADREQGGVQVKSASSSMVMAHFSTSDAAQPVIDFYKSKLPGAVAVSASDGTVLTSGDGTSDTITVTITPGEGAEKGKTTIMILNAKKPRL